MQAAHNPYELCDAPNGIRTRATALKGPRPGPLVDGGRREPGYRYMTQRDVAPQAQSLCFTVHARQLQCSHQIHLRWFTSSTKRATIQRRISVRDTLSNVSTPRRRGQWARGPNLPGCRSYEYGAKRSSEEPLRPDAFDR
jgi:hypothetical protein